MHDINSRRLMHLVALAEEGSFARAAARTHLSQSAFSRSIQALEDDLGVKLFDRAARGVAMTAAGNLMVGRARRVLFETRCLFRDLELLKAHEFGEVRVGVGPYVAAVLLPKLIVGFSRRFPKVRIAVEVGEADTLLGKLRAEQLDLLVVDRRLQAVAPDVTLQRLARHEGAWYARAGHPLFTRGELALDALREFPLVSVPMPAFMKDALHRLLRIRSHEQIPLQAECNDIGVLAAVVGESDAVFFATASSIRAELDAGRLIRIPLARPPRLTLDFALVHLAERTPSPAATAAMELAAALMNDAAEQA
ncbi:LysR family transcriptional regulator [Burkholderia cepacia]|uniref:LysR family transcriptional regulator n=1 Tax=Burkholderia cepacia TaxID=292 RepID=UPI00398E461D